MIREITDLHIQHNVHVYGKMRGHRKQSVILQDKTKSEGCEEKGREEKRKEKEFEETSSQLITRTARR